MLPGDSSSQRSEPSPVANFSFLKPMNTRSQLFLPRSSSVSSPIQSRNTTQQHQETEHILDTPRNKAPRISSPAAANNQYFKEEIIENIFVNLPAKSLLRFRCLSKHWGSIISRSDFRSLNLRRSRKCHANDFLFFNPNDNGNAIDILSLGPDGVESVRKVSVPLSNSTKIRSIKSCNGLLCIEAFGLISNSHRIIVYNPTTDKQVTIISRPNEDNVSNTEYVNIAFDPLKSDHYKLVSVGIKHNGIRFLVYSSESRAWMVTGDIVEMSPLLFYFNKGVLWNGDFHWFGADRSTLCFDLDAERVRSPMPRIPADPAIVGQYDDAYYGEVGENLCFFCLKNAARQTLLDIFALKRDYSEWFVKYQVDFASLTRLHSVVRGLGFNVLCFVVDEGVKKTRIAMLESVEGPLHFDSSGFTGATWFDAFPHVETLASV